MTFNVFAINVESNYFYPFLTQNISPTLTNDHIELLIIEVDS